MNFAMPVFSVAYPEIFLLIMTALILLVDVCLCKCHSAARF
jgi:hypothetical protein